MEILTLVLASHGGLWFLMSSIFLSVRGQTVTLEGSPSALQGTSHQFICTVSGSTLGFILPFVRGTGSAPDIPCIVNTGTCQEHQSANGYSCACVTGETRKYYLNISSVTLQDDDSWQCQYSGVSSSTINLDVQYPPTITSVPSRKDVRENDSPSITCSSNITPGNPSSTSYRWTGPGGYSKTGAVLDRIVTRTRGGQYTCTANNTIGSDTAHVNINVQYAPSIRSVPSNKDVQENTSPNIDCSSNITQGNPSSTSYRWTGPGGFSKTGAVLDRPVTRTQGGQYTCTATNIIGSDSANVKINVQYPPTITSVPSNKDVTENNSPNIDCSSNITPGNPTSTSYRWTGPDDYNPPTIASVPSNAYVAENSSPNIDCSTNITPGNPPATSYRWTGPGGYNKNGAVLDRVITTSEERTYTCTATNTAGLSDTAVINVSVISSPSAPTSFQVKVMGDMFVTLRWISNFNGGANQQFHVEYEDARSYIKSWGIPDPGRDETVSWNITRLEADAPYSFHVYSENVKGRSESVELNITTMKSSLEKLTNCNSGIGRCLGIGFGVCLPVIILLIIGGILVFRRQKSSTEKQKEANVRDLSQGVLQPSAGSSVSEIAYSALEHDANTGTQYEKIQMNQKESEVHVYENAQ